MVTIKYLSQRKSKKFSDEWYCLAQENHFWMQWRLQVFLRQLDNLGFSKTRRFRGLEIGSGEGVLRRQLESVSNWVIDGVDLNEKSLRKNKNCRGRTFFYDIFDCHDQFRNYYDFVILYDILEHIKDENSFLHMSAFHLKKGGYLFINVPALNIFLSNYDKTVGHVRRYNKKMIKSLLNKNNLMIKDVRYWGLFMLPLLFLRKLISWKYTRSPEIIKKGFEPPGAFFNQVMKKVMRAEMFLFKKPPVGTSLLAAAVKV